MFIIEGGDSVHCVAFFILPQIMVRHFKIGPAVQKLDLILDLKLNFTYEKSLGKI